MSIIKHHFLSPRMGRVRHIHFIGIGGAGMCGIAEVLHNEGYRISGSDVAENRMTTRLRELGIDVRIGHHKDNLEHADVVVRSTAILDENPEIVAAYKHQIPVIPRAAMLAELMRFRHGIAIAGTHGKTTTTSLVSSLLAEGGLDPSFVIGGKLNSCGSNARLGSSEYLVVEADESDASFLFLKPMMAVVTNIDADHMSTYGHDFNKLRATFVEFLHHLPFYGLAVLCIDDQEVRRIASKVQRPMRTYGFSDDAHVRATNWRQDGLVSEFTVIRPQPHAPLSIRFKLPGQHNVLNALAAITIATELGLEDTAIEQALWNFEGVGRRFQILNERIFPHGKALVVDDYGHHPREIQSTIAACRAVWPEKRLVHVFQPHRYTRTQELFDEFVNVLHLADQVLLLDIYAAGEVVIEGLTSQRLADAANASTDKVKLVTEKNLEQALNQCVLEGDVVLMQGAGSIGQLALQIAQNSSL